MTDSPVRRLGPEPVAGPGGSVVVRGLSKAYGAVQAVADVSFHVDPGEIVGLLGPNGAGKSTTIEAMLGLVTPDAGSVEICGQDVRGNPREARRLSGVALQATGLQDGITPAEAIGAFAALHGARVSVEAALRRFGLAGKADARVATLSGGERQRLALALALINEPAAVFLDEPTAQLDPQARRGLHDEIRAMKGEGRAVLLATHDMDEAESLCDRVVVMNAGKLVAQGPPRTLTAGWAGSLRVEAITDRPVAAEVLAGLPVAADLVRDGTRLTFSTTDANAALAAMAAAFAKAGVRVESLTVGRGGLEDFVLALGAGTAGQ